ncbi:MAG: T9SS type A sorting domain-containing protein [Flavobacteriales bacterium]
MKKLAVAFICICSYAMQSQSIHFNMSGQPPLMWNLSDISQILYGPSDMTVEFAAGGSYEIPYVQIISFRFEESNVAVSELNIQSVNDISLFPNPAKDQIQLRYQLKGSDQLRVGIYHLDGRLVKEVMLGSRMQGMQNEVIDIRELPAGSYVCKLFGNSWSTALPWTKQSRD